MKVLEAENITKIYNSRAESSTKALNGISFSIEKGEFVGIMGPSGSGKTTLLNILSGISNPTSGSTIISGKDINSMDESSLALFRRQKMGFVFQEFNLLDSLTIKENIMLPMILDGRSDKEMNEKADRIMSVFDIAHIKGKYPYEVSGGQQQRGSAARALITKPKVIFADEPTGALDTRSSSDLLECMTRANKEEKATIIMVTHDAISASYSDKVYMLTDGEIKCQIEKGSSRKEFYSRILDLLASMGGAR